MTLLQIVDLLFKLIVIFGGSVGTFLGAKALRQSTRAKKEAFTADEVIAYHNETKNKAARLESTVDELKGELKALTGDAEVLRQNNITLTALSAEQSRQIQVMNSAATLLNGSLLECKQAKELVDIDLELMTKRALDAERERDMASSRLAGVLDTLNAFHFTLMRVNGTEHVSER